MKDRIESQYDGFAEAFTQETEKYNERSRAAFYAMFNFDMSGRRLLDVGCGDGYDLNEFQKRDVLVEGIDSSKEMIKIAKTRLPETSLIVCPMESLPYEDASFDVVTSKYALQTSRDVPKSISEMCRVLRPGGILAYLTVHPLRQFLEKGNSARDYYRQDVVESNFFGGTVTAHEPTHTMEEYLNTEFLAQFQIDYFREHSDFPSARGINGDIYPCFFVLKAQKKTTTSLPKS
ncbi:MAG: class I SAM-dependent methyltransferase [archaeon]